MSLRLPPLRVVGRDGKDGQDAKPEEGSPYPKCSLWLRAGARVFDLSVAWGLWITAGQAGAVVALLFLLLADGMLLGQSAGKRLFGIKVIHLPTRAAARYRESVLRNAPFALIVLLGMMPDPLGPVAAVGGFFVIGGVEAWKVVRDPLGFRLGDEWGETQVVDGKVVIGALGFPTARTASADGRVMYAANDRSSTGGTTCASR